MAPIDVMAPSVEPGIRPGETIPPPNEWGRQAWLESTVLFWLLIPFFAWFLRSTGPLYVFGFVYVAALIGYMAFLSPFRRPEPEARKSLHEAVAMLTWAMFVLWGIMPYFPAGRIIGNVLLTLSGAYILLWSWRRHGDSPGDWGLGSPAEFFHLLGRNPRVRWAWLLGNALVVALAFLFPDVFLEMLRGFVRKSFGIKQLVLSPAILAGIYLVLFNVTLPLVRWDNFSQAARFIGWYLLIGGIVVATAGYVYIYLIKGGWVELRPWKGLTGVGAYIIWGTVQELLFLSYFNTRIRKGISSPYLSALLTAVIFGLFHLTAYTLMFICFLIGIVWAHIFQAAPNLLLMGFSHGAGGGFGTAFQVQGFEMIRIKASVGPFNP